jgi:trigger factor
MAVAIATSLNVSVETSSGLERRMTVKVPAAEIEQEIDTRLAKLSRTARLKGFRPGRAPAKVVRQRYGAQVREEVLSDVIRSSYSRALAEVKLTPAGGPRIETLADAGDSTFGYRAVFEVYPDIEIGQVEGLAIEKPVVTVGAAEIDKTLEGIRRQRASWREVASPAAEGHRVVLDFEGTLDGKPIAGGEGKEVAIVVGAHQVIEDFDRGLQGLGAGQSATLDVRFPDDYPAKELAGKSASFAIKVHRVEEEVLPEIDADFIASLGVEEGGIERLRADVQANLERELGQRLRSVTRRQVLAQFLRANPVVAPRAVVEQEIDILQGAAMRQAGIKDAKDGPARETFRALAEDRAKLALLVQELIRRQNIVVERSRLDAKLAEIVQPYENPREAEQYYRGHRELMGQVESSVLEEQVVDFLLERAKVTEKPLGFDEFMNQ